MPPRPDPQGREAGDPAEDGVRRTGRAGLEVRFRGRRYDVHSEMLAPPMTIAVHADEGDLRAAPDPDALLDFVRGRLEDEGFVVGVVGSPTESDAASTVRAFFAACRPSLRLPDGWYGRPYDNQHELTAIEVTDRGMRIELDGLVELDLAGPVTATTEAGMLRLAGFTLLVLRSRGYGSAPQPRPDRRYDDGVIELVAPAPHGG